MAKPRTPSQRKTKISQASGARTPVPNRFAASGKSRQPKKSVPARKKSLPGAGRKSSPTRSRPKSSGLIRIIKSWHQDFRDLTRREPETIWFGALMLAAMILRFMRPDWYLDRQFHPDERWIFGVVSQLSYPAEPAGLQYGTFPLYLLSLLKDFAGQVAGWFGHFDANRFVIYAGRMLSACFDLGTIIFTYLLGRRLQPGAAGRGLGLLAAAFLSFTVLNIQMSHFFVVDVPLGLLVMGTLYWAVGIARTGRRRDYVMAGICFGLAMATKTSALPLVISLGTAHLIGLSRDSGHDRIQRWQDLSLTAGVSLLVFFIAMPHAFLDWAKFWINQNEQRRILVTGAADVPYNRQYLNTLPYIYYAKNLVRYTMGIPLGILTLTAFMVYPLLALAAIIRAMVRKSWKSIRDGLERESGLIIIMSFAVAYALIIGVSFAKFNRYILPLTPILCLAGARLALGIKARLAGLAARRIAGAVIGLILVVTMLWALAFASIYTREHPWVAASRWIMEHLPAKTMENGFPRPTAILNEEWGDDLPTHVKDIPLRSYRINKFPVQEPDNPRKRKIILNMLQKNELVVMADTRAHALYRRLWDRYPINAAYYELMFEEKLGFKLVAEFKNYPGLGGRFFPDDEADESFTLYDHPHVYLFQRAPPDIQPDELARVLDGRVSKIGQRKEAKPELREKPAARKTRPEARVLPTVINANHGEPQGRPIFIFGKLNSFTAGLAWVLLLEIIGLLSIPLCLCLFPRLPDSGVALSKIIGTLILAWTTWMLVSMGVVRHLQSTTLLVLLVLGGASVWWACRRRTEIREFIKVRGGFWISAEVVFLLAFIAYMLTKLYNPDINNPFGQGYNGGGEPMGISFFTAVYQSIHFPPYDPWLSGYHINYYYFGHVILGILAKLTGVPPGWSYNIAISLLFALTVTGVYGLGVGLTGKRVWGVAAALAAATLGNLHTFFYIWEPLCRGINWNDALVSLSRRGGEIWQHIGRFEFIWNPTRLIKGTINEMPWFSFLYGDLHAHIIAIPYSLPLIGWGLNVLMPVNSRTTLMPEAPGRTGTERGLIFFVTALTLGSLSAINTWNFPPYALLVLGVLAARVFQDRKGRSFPWTGLGTALLGWLRLVIGGLALFFFFHKYFIPQSTSLALVNPEARTHLKDFLVFFGLPIFILLTYWAGQLIPRARRLLTRFGGYSRSRRSWWERLAAVIQRIWEKHPRSFYSLAALLAAILLLVLFSQVLLAGLLLMLIAGAWVLGWQPLTAQMRMAMLLAMLGLAVVLGCEIVHVRDFMGVGGDMSRMNTVFKFYMVVWIYFALAAAAAGAQIFSGRREERKAWSGLLAGARKWRLGAAILVMLILWVLADYFQKINGAPWLTLALGLGILVLPWIWVARPKSGELRLAWAAMLGAILFSVALYPPLSLYNRMRLCSEFKNPTLNGMEYLNKMRPKEAKALAWINRNIKHTDIVLEAPGRRGYNCFDTRSAIFTGQPTLIGWIGQEEQMRYNSKLTGSRTRDADLIYKTQNIKQARQLIEQYRIRYVLVGENERSAYPSFSLEKFRGFMDVVYEQEGVIIFRKRK